MRTKGYMRPLSVIDIRSSVRRKYSKLGLKALTSMLTSLRKYETGSIHMCYSKPLLFLGNRDGTIVAEKYNPAVPSHILTEVWIWQSQGATFEDVVDRLRPRTVPPGYLYNSWKAGTYDTLRLSISCNGVH